MGDVNGMSWPLVVTKVGNNGGPNDIFYATTPQMLNVGGVEWPTVAKFWILAALVGVFIPRLGFAVMLAIMVFRFVGKL
jgi:hypothetical protein